MEPALQQQLDSMSCELIHVDPEGVMPNVDGMFKVILIGDTGKHIIFLTLSILLTDQQFRRG